MKQFILSLAVICTLTSCTKEALVPDIAPRVSSSVTEFQSILDFGAAYHQTYTYEQISIIGTVFRSGTCLFLDDQTMSVHNLETDVQFAQQYNFDNGGLSVYFDDLQWQDFVFDVDSNYLITQFPQFQTSLIIYLD